MPLVVVMLWFANRELSVVEFEEQSSKNQGMWRPHILRSVDADYSDLWKLDENSFLPCRHELIGQFLTSVRELARGPGPTNDYEVFFLVFALVHFQCICNNFYLILHRKGYIYECQLDFNYALLYREFNSLFCYYYFWQKYLFTAFANVKLARTFLLLLF